MKMYKYPSIDQFRTLIKNIITSNSYEGKDQDGNAIYNASAIPPKITISGTVKLHGTNASIVLDKEGNLYTQSRERILTVEQDNAGFAMFGITVKDIFASKLQDILSETGALAVAVYGEWCGKGIQKGVGVSELDKMFVMFGIKAIYPSMSENPEEAHTSVWLDNKLLSNFVNPDKRVFNIYDFETYELLVDLADPQMVQNKLIEITEKVEKECPVAKHFGIENGCGEGVVWTANFKGNSYRMKVKGSKHSVTKVKKLAEVDVEKMESVNKFIEYAVTENRLMQGINHFKENGIDLDVKNTGKFISWVASDVIKEEIDTMSASNITTKDFGAKASVKSRRFFINYIDSNL